MDAYHKCLEMDQGGHPNQEWQAQQRLNIFSRGLRRK